MSHKKRVSKRFSRAYWYMNCTYPNRQFVIHACPGCTCNLKPGRVAQSVGHLTRKSGVLGFYTRSGNILSFLLPLFQEGQLSVTGESMCTKNWLTA